MVGRALFGLLGNMTSIDDISLTLDRLEVTLNRLSRDFYRRLAAIEADVKRQRRRALQRAITRALCKFSEN